MLILCSLLAATGAGDPVLPPTTSAEGAVAPPFALHERSRAVSFSDQPDGLWAAGETYKSRASEDGFTYFPFLGSDAPRNYPVRFQLSEATIGSEPIALAAKSARTRTGERVVLDRGPVDVIYDYAPDSIEQSFLVDAQGAAGDLVLVLDVETDLVARRDADDEGGLRFDGPEGGVLYGAAVAFDSLGGRADVRSELFTRTSGDIAIRLTVPSQFMDSAKGPILVDPLISTWAVQAAPRDQLNPDVTYDGTSSRFLYVYEEKFSTLDNDIYFSTVDEFGNPFQSGIMFMNAENCIGPAVANRNTTNRCLCVFSQEFNLRYEVWGRSRDMISGTLGSPFRISAAPVSGAADGRPDVAGNQTSDPTSGFLVTWVHIGPSGNSEPTSRFIQLGGSMGPIERIDGGLGLYTPYVQVSASIGLPGSAFQWNVAYVIGPAGTAGNEIRGVQYNADGTLREAPNVLLAATSSVGIRRLAVSDTIAPAGQEPTYIVAFQQESIAGDDIYVLTCRDNEGLSSEHLQALEHGPVELDQFSPAVATTREEFLISYAECVPPSGCDIFVTSLDLVGDRLAVSERRTLAGNTLSSRTVTSPLASRYSSGLTFSRWTGIGLASRSPVSWDIQGGIIVTDRPTAVGIQGSECVGAINSSGERGFLLIQGDDSIDQPKTLACESLPPNTFGFFNMGTDLANVPMAGGSEGTLCIGGQIGRYDNAVLNSGSGGDVSLTIDPTALRTPSGTVPAMPGATVAFQYWHRDTQHGGGGQATSNFTNAALLIFR